ncbi:MAG: fumarylacetoacetate hydrolase family protein [Armatimonadetes bacterium]|nr:fumarylacetoacetate hydrolase family protein [Armatimonadota bacterium]
MKLCRFELSDTPGETRSGIYHEGRYYETDGQNAIGVHEPNVVRLLSPIGQPPAYRAFDAIEGGPTEGTLFYHYLNPAGLQGTETEIVLPPAVLEADFEVRIGAVIQDKGLALDPREANGFILGYLITCVITDARRIDESIGAQPRDVGLLAGPFLVTPDDLGGHLTGESQSNFVWPYEISINGTTIQKASYQSDYEMTNLLVQATETSSINVGEIVSWPPLPKPRLSETEIGRGMMPSDKVLIRIEGLGALTFRVA